MLRFALIGAAGYVAPRHMKAIKDVGGELVAVLDPHDSVGVLDFMAPGCLYFRDPERFERWLLKNPVDYVSVCSPNYLHDSHCIMGLRAGADVICEKPLVCHERNIDFLSQIEEETGKSVNVVLQCRLHPEVVEARNKIKDEHTLVQVDYTTPRGPWYQYSWKGDTEKSGGLATNIGIHLFDLCSWLFGNFISNRDVINYSSFASGRLNLTRATVDWKLATEGTKRRSFKFDCDGMGHEIDLTSGFDDLHTETYNRILSGSGYGIEEIRTATKIVEDIRYAGQ